LFQGAKYDAAPLLTALKKVFGAWCEQVEREGGRMGERERKRRKQRERETEKAHARAREKIVMFCVAADSADEDVWCMVGAGKERGREGGRERERGVHRENGREKERERERENHFLCRY